MSSNFSRTRHKARYYVIQALYGWQITYNNIGDIELDYLTTHKEDKFDIQYFLQLFRGITSNITVLDTTIEKYIDRKLNNLTLIELAVLRLATFELTSIDDVPYKVVINEALELAKTFGAQDGYKFVNGVLDRLAADYRIAVCG